MDDDDHLFDFEGARTFLLGAAIMALGAVLIMASLFLKMLED